MLIRCFLVMKRINFFTLCFLIFSNSLFAELPDYEITVRQFLNGLIDRDEKAIRNTCLDNHSLDILWKRPVLSEELRKEQKYKLAKTNVEWLKVGETFRFNNHAFTVHENMVTAKKQIARVKLVDYGFPIHLSKVAGQWSIQPFFIIDSYKRDIKEALKKLRKDYTVSIDESEIQLNEGEELTIKLADGRELKLKLKKNLLQNHRDDLLSLSYSRDLEFSKHPTAECMIYRFNSELTANIMIQVYEKSSSLEECRKHVMNSFIENYEVAEYILEENPIREIKSTLKGKLIKAYEIFSKRNGVVHVDHFIFWQDQDKIIGGILQMELKDSSAGRDFFNHIINEIELTQASIHGAK